MRRKRPRRRSWLEGASGSAGAAAKARWRDLDTGRIFGWGRAQRHLPEPRGPRRGRRDRLRPPSGSPIGTSWSSSSRSMTRPRWTGRGNDVGPATARRSSTRATISARSPRRRSPTSTPRACGPARSSPRVSEAGPFWEAEPEHQDYLQRIPNGYTCHFVRPDWKLAAPREDRVGRRHGVARGWCARCSRRRYGRAGVELLVVEVLKQVAV